MALMKGLLPWTRYRQGPASFLTRNAVPFVIQLVVFGGEVVVYLGTH